jgi:hypothetical protein
MNFKVKWKKEYLDRLNAETGEWSKDSIYMVSGQIEYYNSDWETTRLRLRDDEPEAQIIAQFQMFDRQWDSFKEILIEGAKYHEGGSAPFPPIHNIRFEPELEDDWHEKY